MPILTSSTIKLNLSPGILANAKVESERIGISLQDFIRMLMATYFAKSSSIQAINRDETLYNRATQEINLGQFKTVKNRSDLVAYLKKLSS